MLDSRTQAIHRSSSTVASRAQAVHLRATDDHSWVEPLPLHGEDFSEEVAAIGRDFDLTMQQIEHALPEKGPFSYMHPIWGQLDVVLRSPAQFQDRPNVVVNKCSIRLDLRRAAVAQPAAPTATVSAVGSQVDGVQDALDSDSGAAVLTHKLTFADLI